MAFFLFSCQQESTIEPLEAESNPSEQTEPEQSNPTNHTDVANTQTDSDGQEYITITHPSFNTGDIFVYVHEDDAYCEYLKFSSGTAGNYYVYKNNTEVTNERSNFTYLQSSGYYNEASNSNEGYLFEDSAGHIYGAKQYAHRKKGNGLLTEWTNGYVTFQFFSDRTYTGSNAHGTTISGRWNNNKGVIFCDDDNSEENDMTFYYTSDGRLYFPVYSFQSVQALGHRPDTIMIDGEEYVDLKYPSFSSSDVYVIHIKTDDVDEYDYYDFNTKYAFAFDAPGYSWEYKTRKSFTYSSTTGEFSIDGNPFAMTLLETQSGTKYLASVLMTKQSSGLYGQYSLNTDYFGTVGNIVFNEDGSISGDDQYGNITGSFTKCKGILSVTYSGAQADGSKYTNKTIAVFTKQGLYFGVYELKKTDKAGGDFVITIGNLIYNEEKTKVIEALGDGSEGYTILDSVKEICKRAFYDKSKLTQLSLPEGLETIGSEAFCYTSLKTLEIPHEIKYIGSGAFLNIRGNFEGVTVKTGNVQNSFKQYYSDNGAVYWIGTDTSGTDKVLVYCPKQPNNYFEVPNGVTLIDDGAFDYWGDGCVLKVPSTLIRLLDYPHSLSELWFEGSFEQFKLLGNGLKIQKNLAEKIYINGVLSEYTTLYEDAESDQGYEIKPSEYPTLYEDAE